MADKTTLSLHKRKPQVKIAKKPKHYTEQYRDLFTMRMKPVPQSFIEKISLELIHWALNNDNALTLKRFFYEHGIPNTYVTKWMKKYPILNEAIDEARFLLGIRREEGALKKIFDAGTMKASLHHYDPAVREDIVWQAELKQKMDEKTQNNNISWVLEKFPSSNLVPEKPKEKDEE